jgi:spore maturation protein A
MLNYIWAGLIVFSLVFALIKDFGDIAHDRYRNGAALPVTIHLDSPNPTEMTPGESRPVHVMMDPAAYRAFYHNTETPAASYPAVLSASAKGEEIRFPADAIFPAPLAKLRDQTTPDDDRRLPAEALDVKRVDDATLTASLRFQSVRFATMNDIANAAMTTARDTVTLRAFPLIGVIALWLGLTRVGERAGLIAIFNKLVRPVLKPLYPEVPPDHPAMGFMALNLTANILGMGNAATPMGLKAMEELQTLNPKKDTATNSMVMLLAMHASSIQLLPPVLVIAVMGLRATNELLLPIWIVSAFGLTMGIVAAVLLGKLPGNIATDPNQFAGTPLDERTNAPMATSAAEGGAA